MTADDLTRLREIAAAAMCDNWYLQPFTHEGSMGVEVRAEAEFDDGNGYDKFLFQTQDSEAASFIATFDPPTVTALIERAERAERERDELREEAKSVAFTLGRSGAELAALRAAVTGLADATGSAFPYVQVRELRALLTDGGDNDGQ